MEANRKHRVLTKWRLNMPLYSAPKAVARTTSQYNSKPEPPVSAAKYTSNNNAKLGFVVNHDCITPQPKQKVAIAPAEYKKFESFYGVVADESVDIKAATYISSVQQRFKLERVNSDRKISHDMHKKIKG